MATPSLLGLTGQYWKLVAGMLLLLVGSIAPLFEATGMSWTVGTIVACVGYAFTLLAVRCPNCGSRWFWQAALDAGVYRPLFKESTCPSCQHDFSNRG
ncbi:MAG: hypothetical protein H3C57_03840 [Gammaproteobacteria bacterium]|nr:hypothetical protein [Gammaproteobacteria bacterium]